MTSDRGLIDVFYETSLLRLKKRFSQLSYGTNARLPENENQTFNRRLKKRLSPLLFWTNTRLFRTNTRRLLDQELDVLWTLLRRLVAGWDASAKIPIPD